MDRRFVGLSAEFWVIAYDGPGAINCDKMLGRLIMAFLVSV